MSPLEKTNGKKKMKIRFTGDYYIPKIMVYNQFVKNGLQKATERFDNFRGKVWNEKS